MRRALLVLAIAAALPPVPGHAATLSVLDEATGSGPRWVSHKVSTDGAHVTAEIGARNIGRGAMIHAGVYDDQNRLRAGVSWIVIGWKEGYYVDGDAAGIHIDTLGEPRPDGDIRIIASMNDPRAPPAVSGTFKLLLFASGDAESWDYAVKGAPGARIDAMESGTSTFFYLGKDLSTTAQAQAHVLLPDSLGGLRNWGVRAIVQGSRSVEVHDTLVASFGHASYVPNVMSIDTPNGPVSCTPWGCSFNRFEGPFHRGPGRYTFNVTGAAAGLSYMAEQYLCGADARLAA